MTPALKRLAFPLRGPRMISLSFLAAYVFAAAVDGYYQSFFAVLSEYRK